MLTVDQIAKVCHEVNRGYCESLNDHSQLPWEEAPEWQKESERKGVQYHLDNPNSKPSDSHECWMQEKIENGWRYGETKDEAQKTHPCMVPYDQLPADQKSKDYLFLSVVRSLESQVDGFFWNRKMVPVDESTQEGYAFSVKADKHLRRNLDVELGRLQSLAATRERALSITKLEESIMWLGKDLGRLREENPYPESKNPESLDIEKTADGLKNL